MADETQVGRAETGIGESPVFSCDRIAPEQIDAEARRRLEEGWHLVQLCGFASEGGVGVLYTFVRDGVGESVRVLVAPDGSVPSVTETYPAAFVFENELAELYGVNVEGISIDFKGGLYGVGPETPLKPQVEPPSEGEGDAGSVGAAEALSVGTASPAVGAAVTGEPAPAGAATIAAVPVPAPHGRSVIPFGPQHPVLPEPIHLDLEIEDEKVVRAVPQIGFIHRGLEKLVEIRDYKHYVYVTERICGICSFGHSCGYSQVVEAMMGIEIPPRAEYLRVIWKELSRIHSHLLWLGLLADAFGFENLFYQCWNLRENILDIFERTAGGRVILSACSVGGVNRDIFNVDLADIVSKLEDMGDEYRRSIQAFIGDRTVASRLDGIGVLSHEDAVRCGCVGPFAKASGVRIDVRTQGIGAYGALEGFEPVLSDGCDGLARAKVRIEEISQSISIIRELVAKIPAGPISVKVKGNPPADVLAQSRIEQPRGEAYYMVIGNGTKFLDRFRVRTPTNQNLAGLLQIMSGCDLADVPLNILTIDPCISCIER